MCVSREWFEQHCPNLWAAINDPANQKPYQIYGIPFTSHSPLTYWDYVAKYEREREGNLTLYLKYEFPKYHNEEYLTLSMNGNYDMIPMGKN